MNQIDEQQIKYPYSETTQDENGVWYIYTYTAQGKLPNKILTEDPNFMPEIEELEESVTEYVPISKEDVSQASSFLMEQTLIANQNENTEAMISLFMLQKGV